MILLDDDKTYCTISEDILYIDYLIALFLASEVILSHHDHIQSLST